MQTSGYLPVAGDRIGGFMLLEPLGQGGMGQVYRAKDETLGREVAIKFIDLSELKNEYLINEVKKRFIREARVLAAINHPNVVEIYSASLEFRCPYIVMQFFKGRPLYEFQDEYGVIDFKRCCMISLQICEALDYCWENYKVLHRDLKPANILISHSGQIKIIDWGIAKVTQDMTMNGSLATRSDMRLGTPHFMAPEQQINPGDVGHAADIYSMGMIIWQMLAGTLPFSANSEAVIFSQKQKGPERNLTQIVPELPAAIADLIYEMLEPDPQKRIQSYAKIRSALQREINKFDPTEQLFPKEEPRLILKPLIHDQLREAVPEVPPSPAVPPKARPLDRAPTAYAHPPAGNIIPPEPMFPDALRPGKLEPSNKPQSLADQTSNGRKLLIIHKTKTEENMKRLAEEAAGHAPMGRSIDPSPLQPPQSKSVLQTMKLDHGRPPVSTIPDQTPAIPVPPATTPPTANRPARAPHRQADQSFLAETTKLKLVNLPDSQSVDSEIFPGKEIGKYKVIQRIGMGGTGVLMRGENLSTGEEVALKFLVCEPIGMKNRMVQFRNDDAAINSLQHTSLVTHHQNCNIEGYNVVVTDLLLGHEGRPVNLMDSVQTYGNHEQILSQYDLRSILLIILEGLTEIHSLGLVHGNLKPQNIMFPAGDGMRRKWYSDLKITDTGLIRLIGESFYRETMQKAKRYAHMPPKMKSDIRALLTTFDYMSPEQRRGDEAVPQSDIFAVGMIILRMLTGKTHLYIHRRPSTLRTGIDASWDHIILRALKENISERYSSAAEMAADVANLPF